VRVLLISPPDTGILKNNSPAEIEKNTGLFPPLNILTLASYLNNSLRHSARVLDLASSGENRLKRFLKLFNPKAVGITCVSFNLPSAIMTASLIKKFDPEIKIIFGGPHPTVFPEETLRLKEVDFVVKGEGEKTLLELIDALSMKKSFSGIRGLYYQESGVLHKNPERELIENLDTLPFPDRGLLAGRKYYNILSLRYPSTTMLSGRGCMRECTFCLQSLGRTLRLRSCNSVVDEMQTVIGRGIKDIFFVDDAFSESRERVIRICREIIKRKLRINWAVKGRTDNVDLEMLRIMRKAGCRRIHFGVESANINTLRRMKKRNSPEKAIRAFRSSRIAGIQTGAELMLGAPGETYSDSWNTVEFARELNPDYAFFYITTPYPGTPLYEESLREGVIRTDYWRQFAENPYEGMNIRYWEEFMDAGELDLLLKKAYKSFYFRPDYMLKTLMRTGSPVMLIRRARLAASLGYYTVIS